MRYLNTVYLAGYGGRLTRAKGSLVFARDGLKQRIPLEGIDAVVILGAAEVTVDALATCAKEGVRVAALKRSGTIRFSIQPPRGGNVHLRVAQVEAALDESRTLQLAKTFVGAKLQSCRRLVLRWARDETRRSATFLTEWSDTILRRLQRLPSATTGDQVRGIEGDAARAYFAAMGHVLSDGPFPFLARNRRPPRDPVNAMLGFCYGLLVAEVEGAAQAAGLDHQVGFLHRARSGRPSLALDLAEELRPLADRFVVRLLRRRELSPTDFVVTPGGACFLGDDARSRVIRYWEHDKAALIPHAVMRRPVERWTLPTVQATLLARHLRGDLPVYPPFVLAA
jgi:CRISPR-associated protein Cas1